MRTQVLRSACTYAFTSTAVMAALVYTTNIFNKVQVGKGFDQYAEMLLPWMPWYCAMPFNSLANISYIGVGLYWLLFRKKSINLNFYSGVFLWLTTIYSFIQYARVATQLHFSAVLDQWCTLHLASWALIWTLSLQFADNQWSIKDIILMDFLLCLLYPIFAIIYSGGFRFLLALHITFIFGLIIRLHRNTKDENSRNNSLCLLFLVVMSSFGFILFSLLDLILASLWPSIFTVFSGNFLSSLCDALQLHFLTSLFTKFEYDKNKMNVEKTQ